MNQAPTYPYEGVLLVDKFTGWTSHDVVDAVRGKCRMKKIGHAGTLDPNATGLLLLLLGKATRLSQYLTSNDKIYEGTLTLGATTNTYDIEGEKKSNDTGTLPDKEALATVFKAYLGDQYQLPPMFSAKKIDGVPLYKHARKGRDLERKPHFIRIHSLDMLESKDEAEDSVEGEQGEKDIAFRVACSKGTYVRSLVHDMGQRLECGAYLKALRRTQSGDFKVDNAQTIDAIREADPQALRRSLVPIYKAAPSYILS